MPRPAIWIVQCLLILWASPNSLLGIAIGLLSTLLGGRMRLKQGALECYDGLTRQLVRRLPTGPATAGITLGHVILGQTAEGLDAVANHERVHVRQYERWGPLFIPAYFFLSARAWYRGQDPYRDNPFEVEAYRVRG